MYPEEALADTSEDAAKVSGEASAVVAEGSQVDRATEEATLAGEISGDPVASAVPRAAAGVMAGGRGACGPCAKVSSQVHVADVFFIFFIFLKFFSPSYSSSLYSCFSIPVMLCAYFIQYYVVSYIIIWPSSKEGAQVN